MYNYEAFANLDDIDPVFTKNMKKLNTASASDKYRIKTPEENKSLDEFQMAVLITALMLKSEGF